LDAASVQASCDVGGIGVDCGRFRKVGLDLHTIDAGLLGRLNADSRVKAIVVVDPEFSTNFVRSSLAGISIPIHIINLGRPETIWPGLDASGLPGLITGAEYDVVPDATHYSAFPVCKAGAAAILQAEAEEPLCDDPDGHSRNEIHDRLAAIVEAAFRENLPPASQQSGSGN